MPPFVLDRPRHRGPTILDGLHERDGQALMRHGLEISRQAISQHLEVLEEAGLVRTRREGRSTVRGGSRGGT